MIPTGYLEEDSQEFLLESLAEPSRRDKRRNSTDSSSTVSNRESYFGEMVVVRALKDILSIKIKARHDSYCDQFSRLFMTKMLLISSVIMGFDYFSDRVSCMVPDKSALSSEFVHSACWISGFYIYEEMKQRLTESGYYGIPLKVDYDGIDPMGQLCQTVDQFGSNDRCIPMTRQYFLQYQWMPFYIGALAVLYYIPYIAFRMVNTDLISLKGEIKSISCEADNIVKNYFNYKINPISKLRLRILMNILIKVKYIIANVFAFYFTDKLLHGNFVRYGREYFKWAESSTTLSHVPIKYRGYAKPGNKLLPSMGFCEIHEASLDTRNAFHNQNKFICEISPNILYQYVLVVLWLLFIISITISILGFIANLFGHAYHLMCHARTPKKTIYRFITLRETEYLLFIKKKNMVLYGEVLRKLKQKRADLQGKVPGAFETTNGFV